MQNNIDNSTIYTFQESGTGNLLLETKDMSVLFGAVPTQTIARTEKVIIGGVTYVVEGLEIDISKVSSMVAAPGAKPIDQHSQCGVHTTIYLKKSFRLLRRFSKG